MDPESQSNDAVNDIKSDDIDNEDILNVSIDSAGSKRGRPLIPDQWSRIIKVPTYSHQLQSIKTYVIATELLLEEGLPAVPRKTRSKQPWSLYFKSDVYWDEHPGMTISNQTLSYKRLQGYAKQISRLRDR